MSREELIKKLEELDKRMKALEEAIANMNASEDDAEAPEEVAYPEYVAGKWYYAGDCVMFKGSAYDCIAPEGVVCVWSPEEHPAYWQAKTN